MPLPVFHSGPRWVSPLFEPPAAPAALAAGGLPSNTRGRAPPSQSSRTRPVPPNEGEAPLEQRSLTRREFAAASASTLTGAWLLIHMPAAEAAAAWARRAAREGRTFQVLTAAEARTLEAVAEQILPADDTPGAHDLGVIHFMDRALGSFAEFMLEPIRAGVADLEAAAREAGAPAEGFAALPPERQRALLTDVELSGFFFLTRALTLLGAFADPAYGGNSDGAGWRLIGFENRGAYQPPFGHYDRGHTAAPSDGGAA